MPTTDQGTDQETQEESTEQTSTAMEPKNWYCWVKGRAAAS